MELVDYDQQSQGFRMTDVQKIILSREVKFLIEDHEDNRNLVPLLRVRPLPPIVTQNNRDDEKSSDDEYKGLNDGENNLSSTTTKFMKKNCATGPAKTTRKR